MTPRQGRAMPDPCAGRRPARAAVLHPQGSQGPDVGTDGMVSNSWPDVSSRTDLPANPSSRQIVKPSEHASPPLARLPSTRTTISFVDVLITVAFAFAWQASMPSTKPCALAAVTREMPIRPKPSPHPATPRTTTTTAAMNLRRAVLLQPRTSAYCTRSVRPSRARIGSSGRPALRA